MATKSSIVAAIEAKVSVYSAWQIGISHEPADRKQYWTGQGKSTGSWTQWQADSLSDAQDIEAQFIKKGMKGGVGGDMTPGKTTYVYIF
jgi:hypothetical protein